MKIHQIKFKDKSNEYTICLGNNILGILAKKIKLTCPKTKKIAIIVDKKVPNTFKRQIKKKLKKYNSFFYTFSANEKTKSLKSVNFYLDKLLSKNFNRSDLVISIGGGITGDVVSFIASIYKRGINFINIPTTLLAQVDSAIGGKTGVNTDYGKNLIGSFYQPKLVIIDTSFLKSLPKKEIICGYAEILKHSIIKDKNFFYWLKENTQNIFNGRSKYVISAIKKSCMIKLYFVNKDVNEKNLRMKLNFGHTFAHAIEVQSKYSKNISHGDAVLSGMILEARLSYIKKICNYKTVKEIENIYKNNGLLYSIKNISKISAINKLIPYLKHDKKNDDDDINFILLKKIGKTTEPNSSKIKLNSLKKYSKLIAQY